jgi:hypothetical protein
MSNNLPLVGRSKNVRARSECERTRVFRVGGGTPSFFGPPPDDIRFAHVIDLPTRGRL